MLEDRRKHRQMFGGKVESGTWRAPRTFGLVKCLSLTSQHDSQALRKPCCNNIILLISSQVWSKHWSRFVLKQASVNWHNTHTPTQSHTHPLSHTHTHSVTHTQSQTDTHTQHTHIHTHSQTDTHTHTYKHTCPQSLYVPSPYMSPSICPTVPICPQSLYVPQSLLLYVPY